jgi:hypothetical protein
VVDTGTGMLLAGGHGTGMILAGGHGYRIGVSVGFLWHLYGFYDVTRCYLCNNTEISINI